MNMHTGGNSVPSGALALGVERDLGNLRDRPAIVKPGLGWQVKNFLRYRRREVPAHVATKFLGRITGCIRIETSLSLAKFTPGEGLDLVQRQRLKELLAENVNVFALMSAYRAQVVDYGCVSRRMVTNAGVGFIVDAFQNSVELENMKFHAFGTGTTAEAQGDTALVTEETTQYNPDNTRPTGSTTEAAANIFRSVGTYSPDSGGTRAITEHMLMSQAATGGGVGLDRSVFSAVNIVAAADSLQATYDFTITAGG